MPWQPEFLSNQPEIFMQHFSLLDDALHVHELCSELASTNICL